MPAKMLLGVLVGLLLGLGLMAASSLLAPAGPRNIVPVDPVPGPAPVQPPPTATAPAEAPPPDRPPSPPPSAEKRTEAMILQPPQDLSGAEPAQHDATVSAPAPRETPAVDPAVPLRDPLLERLAWEEDVKNLILEMEAQREPERDLSDLEGKEARLAIIRLEQENEKTRKEVLALREQVRRLTHSLAEEKARADRLRLRDGASSQPQERSEAPILTGVLQGTVRIVEVDRVRRFAILDTGRAGGIRPGLEFGVMQDGEAIARLRTTDIRNRVSAAVIEDIREGKYPRAGDRVIPWRGGANESRK